MHPRTPTTVLAIAAISALLMTGCGSTSTAAGGSTGGTGGSGTAGTTGAGTATTGGSTASTAQAGGGTSGAGSATSAPNQPATATTTTTSSLPDTVDGSVAKTGPCAGIESRMVGLNGAASGNTYADLVVTNHGSLTCTLPASPRPHYFAADYKPLATTFSTDPNAKPYQLAPGASASMVIGYGSAANPPCYGRVAFVTVVPSGAYLPFTGRLNCAHDATYDEGWVAGTSAAPH